MSPLPKATAGSAEESMKERLSVVLGALILLSSCGGSPKAALSASNVDFGGQYVNTTSTEQTITLSNPGSARLRIDSITVTPSFQQTNTCGSGVEAKGQCSVSVTFTPTVEGTLTGNISFADNAAGSPQTVSLSGSGVPAPPSCGGLNAGCNVSNPCCPGLRCFSTGGLDGGVCQGGRRVR